MMPKIVEIEICNQWYRKNSLTVSETLTGFSPKVLSHFLVF